MKIRKILSTLTATLLSVIMLASCGSAADAQVERNGGEDEATTSQTTKGTNGNEDTTTAKPADTKDETTTAETTAETTAAPVENNIVPLMINSPRRQSYYNYNLGTFYITPDNNLYRSDNFTDDTEPVFENVRDICINWNEETILVLKTDNTVWVYGGNSYGDLGPKLIVKDESGFDVESNYYPPENAVLAMSNVANFTEDGQGVITTDKKYYDYNGKSSEGFYTETEYTNVVRFEESANWYLKATGELYKESNDSLLVENIVNVYCYNNKFYAKTIDDKLIDVDNDNAVIAEDVNQVFVYDYGNVTSIIKNDGTLWSLGKNSGAQLGDGSKTDREEFVKIADDVIFASPYCYLKTDGTLYEWTDTSPVHTAYTENSFKAGFYDYSENAPYLWATDGGVYVHLYYNNPTLYLLDFNAPYPEQIVYNG
jgi:hypothetical protein